MFFAKIIEPSSIKGAIVLIDDDFSMIIGANTYNVLQGICIGLLKEERGKVAPPLSLLSSGLARILPFISEKNLASNGGGFMRH